MKVIVKPQIWKTHDGQRPITYGVWIGKRFACWTRCFCKANRSGRTASRRTEMKRSAFKNRGNGLKRRGRIKPRKFSKKPAEDGASLRQIKDECDELVRKIIAARDKKCINFDCKQTENLHVGHYIKRGVLALRWDLRNCNAQCDFHNEAHNTNPKPYQDAMFLKYRIGITFQLALIADEQPRVSYVDLLAIRDGLRAEAGRMNQ